MSLTNIKMKTSENGKKHMNSNEKRIKQTKTYENGRKRKKTDENV